MTDRVLSEALEELIRQHGTAREAARALDIAESFFCQIRHHGKCPPPRLLKALGLKRTVVKTVIYEKEAGK